MDRRASSRFLYGTDDARILSMWREGHDTNAISRALWLPEYQVANRLPEILRRAREDSEWNVDRSA